MATTAFQVYTLAIAPREDPRLSAGVQKLAALEMKLRKAEEWIESHRNKGNDVQWQIENFTVAQGLHHLAATELSAGNYGPMDEYVVSAHRMLDRILVSPIVYTRYPAAGASLHEPPILITFSYNISTPESIVATRLLIDGIEAQPFDGLGTERSAWMPAVPLQVGLHTVRFVLIDEFGWEASSEWTFAIVQPEPHAAPESSDPPECPEDPRRCH